VILAGEGMDTNGVCGEREENDDEESPAADGVELDPGFGTVNVNDDCLSAMFSFCRRVKRSLRFSFSVSVAVFLASRAATLSSN
jgi:hypothetical protein